MHMDLVSPPRPGMPANENPSRLICDHSTSHSTGI